MPFCPSLSLSCRRGFSLLELSVVIAIMSVVAVMGLEGAATFAGRTTLATTQEKIVTLDDAVRQFFRVYGRLPCPANVLRPLSNIRVGLEDCNLTAVATAKGGGGVLVGSIPYRTLNIPPNAALDGYGSRFIYAVSKNLTVAGITSGTFARVTGAASAKGLGMIEIRSGRLQQPCSTLCQVLADPAAGTGAASIIFSSGADKRGSFSRNGDLQRACVPTPTASFDGKIDSQNCISTGGATPSVTIDPNVFYDSRYNTGIQEANYFDDIVVWRSKGQL